MRDVATGRQKAQGVGCVETLLAGLREHRLTAYRAMPADVREHYSLEAEIAQNYRGRFAYELLQNADDAMGENGLNDSVAIVLTNDCLLVANTGRPINEDDVRSLCGVSVSTKGVAGRKRASIGHKGMGFKSVLELTDRPSIFSRELSFRFDRTASADLLREEFGGDLLRGQNRAPAMRLPFPAEKIPQRVQQLLDDGMNTVFHFPLDSAKTAHDVARALERMDAKAILFLRRLEKVDIRNELGQTKRASWSLTRELWKEGQGWVPVGELPGAGMVRVHIADETGEQSFAVFSESDIEIQDHRGGIEGASWRDVELTEVSVAMPVDERTDYLQPNSRDPRFHVFLATGERVPFPILINGAFNCDLSRQSIRCGEDPRNYNRFLVEQAGRLLCNRVVQYAHSSGQPVSEMLALFDRSSVVDEDGEPVQPETSAARILISAVRKTLHGNPFIPTGDGEQAPIESIAVFPPFSRDRELGMTIRRQLGDKRVSTRSGRLPAAEVCDAASGEVLGDLGASVLSYSELPKLLERMTPEARITQTRGNGLLTDRTLDLVTRVWWELLADEDKQSFRDAVRERRLFPVGSTRNDGTLNHIRTEGLGCFFPPRSLKGEVPLEGLCFLSRDVCWGTLPPKQRNELLHDEMVAWQAIWDIREFKFPEVMRSAVLPLLRLDRTKEATEPLRRYDVLAALTRGVAVICALLMLASPVRAEDPPDPAHANEVGKILFAEGDFEGARRLWSAAFSRARGRDELALATNLGIACFRLERWADSFYYFTYARAHEDLGHHRIRKHRKVTLALASLGRKLARGYGLLSVRTRPSPNAEVCVGDGEPVCRRSPAEWYLPPGLHTIRVGLPGAPSLTETVRISDRAATRLDLLLPGAAAPADSRAVIAGGRHTCLVSRGGGLRCAGDNRRGQLGGDRWDWYHRTPLPVEGLRFPVAAAAAGHEHSCAVTDAGTVFCWGEGSRGRLGDGGGEGTPSWRPVPVVGLPADSEDLAVGRDHTCAALSTGAVYCWGANDHGQLGTGGGETESAVAIPVTELPDAAVRLAAGYGFTCALLEGGAVHCWGRSPGGASPSPRPLSGASGDVSDVAAGDRHLALLSRGAVLIARPGSRAARVEGIEDALRISAAGDRTCALVEDGAVLCTRGEGVTRVNPYEPGDPRGVDLAVGPTHLCVVLSDGRFRCTGEDSLGQLGR